MDWSQNYDPFQNAFLSTVVASIPIVVLLGAIAWIGMRIHLAALLGLLVALAIAIFGFGMPLDMAGWTAGYGAAYGLFPIGWIILNLIFLYQLTVEKGHFDTLRASLAKLAPDPRVQIILIAFAFGAFFEGAAGFGTPVAVTGAILIQLGFKPLAACGLSLIANTAPVAFGAMGTPIIALSGVTGIDQVQLSAMVGRQLPFFSIIVPFWVVWAYAGWRGMIGVWPAALTAGVAFAVPQYLVSNFHGPWLVDVVASLCSLGALALLLKVWRPKEIWTHEQAKFNQRHQVPEAPGVAPAHKIDPGESLAPASSPKAPVILTPSSLRMAWLPWIVLSLCVFTWGIKPMKDRLNGLSAPEYWAGKSGGRPLKEIPAPKFNVPVVHNHIFRTPPVAPEKKAEAAQFTLNWLSATGTAILLSAIISGLLMGYTAAQMARVYFQTIHRVRFSLITIAAMLSLGYVTKYSGADATLGLALAKTGWLYPFFGTMLGWLGVALTGSDTASNVLFGSLQKITAEQTGISPTLMAAANSSGGVMGKMVDAQSIVVASTATNWYGHEGAILRYVFWHSIILASLVGLLVFLQAYVPPFTKMVVP